MRCTEIETMKVTGWTQAFTTRDLLCEPHGNY